MSLLEGPPEVIETFAAHGVRTVGDVLRGSECVRDLPDRSNHRMRAGPYLVHVKRSKSAGEPREAIGIQRAAGAGVPTAMLVFHGVDPEQVQALDAVENIPDLQKVGHAVARTDVNIADFEDFM